MKILGFLVMLSISLSLVSAVNFDVNEPRDGDMFNSRKVLFDMSASEIGNFFIIKDIFKPVRSKTLCRKSDECQKKVRLSEGDNEVLLKFISSNGEMKVEGPFLFFIDTRNPRIHKAYPKRNSIVRGSEFKIIYTEDNLKEITLHFGGDGPGTISITKDSSECESGKRKECVFDGLDLSAHDGDNIKVWYEVEDITGNVVESKITEVKVDVSPPVIHYFDHKINGKRVNFIFEVEDKNFASIDYVDRKDVTPKTRTLCRKLKDGRCNVRKSFRRGEHELEITAFDKADNSVSVGSLFFDII